MDPSRPGLSFHRVERARDADFWTVRVNRDIRIVVHKRGADLLMAWVGHHDDAYAWAERRRLEVHPRTGAVQLVALRERVQEIDVPATSPRRRRRRLRPRRRPLAAWSKMAPPPARLSVVSSKGEREIQDEIDAAARRAPFVIVDLEGMASQLATFAMSESDMVLVPAQEQHQDAQAAVDTLGAVKRAGRAGRREIPAAVLLTRTRAAVKSRTVRFIAQQLRGIEGVRVLATELNERDAFSALFSSGGGLRQLDPDDVRGIDKAIDNAAAYAAEVIALLRETRK